METQILLLKKNPTEWAYSVDEKTLLETLKLLSNHYYNTDTELVDDTIFDLLVTNYSTRFNKNYEFIGSAIDEKDNSKVKLPYHMGSMDKTKEISGIEKWISKQSGDVNEFVITPKIDGTSALIYIDIQNNQINVYTRGNGTEGKLINFVSEIFISDEIKMNLKKYRNSELDKSMVFVCRGEMIVNKTKFEKFTKIFKSPRSMVNGLTNKKDSDKIKDHLSALDFILFEVIEPKLKPSSQFDLAKKLGFNVVNYDIIKKPELITDLRKSRDNLLLSYLSKTLQNYRDKYMYDIDGIIISSNNVYDLPKEGNPDYSIAFKINQYGKLTKITNIEWNVSKHGQLVPTLVFEPIILGNSRVSKCTGYHGAYIFTNKLGPGAIIRVVLSGEVIPSVTEIISGISEPQMPTCPYKWNSSRIQCEVLEGSNELNIQKIVTFIKALKIDNLAEGMVTHLYNNGFNTIKLILTISETELLKLDRIEDKMAKKILTAIHDKISKPVELSKIMDGSLSFGVGFGEKRCCQIIKQFPNFLQETPNYLDFIKMQGWSDKTAKKFFDGLPRFKHFLKENEFLKVKTDMDNSSSNGVSKSKHNIQKVCITGKKDKRILDFLKQNGIELSGTVTSDVEMLICEDRASGSTKIKTAEKKGIPIFSSLEFIEKYKI